MWRPSQRATTDLVPKIRRILLFDSTSESLLSDAMKNPLSLLRWHVLNLFGSSSCTATREFLPAERAART